MWSFDSQGFVLVLGQDLVIGLQSESSGTEKRLVRRRAGKETHTCARTCAFDLLVQEVFVHHSCNIQQGIPHPKECVFTVRRQTYLPQRVRVRSLQCLPCFRFHELKSMRRWGSLELHWHKPCCRNFAQLQTYDFTLGNNFSELGEKTSAELLHPTGMQVHIRSH